MLAAFNADDPITIQAISEKLKLSSRTVLREMPRINEWFEENDFKLVKKPRIGMYVDEDTETRNYIKELVDMDEKKPVYSKADRQMIILLELLTINEPLKYFYFTSLFHISDATLSNDLEEVETWLDHYNLTLYRRPGMGIYWEGKEEDYRQAVTMVLRQKLRGHSLKVLFDKEKKLKERMFPNLTQEVLDDTRDIIKNMQGVLDIEYTDHSIRHLSLYLLITQNRVRMGHEIKEEKDVRSITHLPEYQIAKWLGGKLSNFEGHQLSQGEVYNIAMQLLAAKIWKNKSENKIDEESFKVRQLVMRIIAEMEILLEMEFFENAVLIDGLCNHMKPAINRMKQGVFTENQYIDFLEEKIEVKEIKKFKDIIIHSDEFEIKTEINKLNNLEVKVENNFLFVFDKTKNELIQLDLKQQVEEKRLEMPSDAIEWAVSDDKVYAATTNTIYTHNANNELETFLEWEDMRGISINDGILTILDFSEEFGSLTSFNLDTLEFCAGTAFEAKEVGLIEASSSEPYVYFHTLNFQGGLTINVVDLKTDNEYLVNLNLNDVKSNLKFYKGHGYYINHLNDATVFAPNGELLKFELEEHVKNIYPFY